MGRRHRRRNRGLNLVMLGLFVVSLAGALVPGIEVFLNVVIIGGMGLGIVAVVVRLVGQAGWDRYSADAQDRDAPTTSASGMTRPVATARIERTDKS